MILAQPEILQIIGIAAFEGICGYVVKRRSDGAIQFLVELPVQVPDDRLLVLTESVQDPVDNVLILDIAGHDVRVAPLEGFLLAAGVQDSLGGKQERGLIVRVLDACLALQVAKQLRHEQIFLPDLPQQGRAKIHNRGAAVVRAGLRGRFKFSDSVLRRVLDHFLPSLTLGFVLSSDTFAQTIHVTGILLLKQIEPPVAFHGTRTGLALCVAVTLADADIFVTPTQTDADISGHEALLEQVPHYTTKRYTGAT